MPRALRPDLADGLAPVTARGGAQPIPRPLSSRDGGPAPWASVPLDRRDPSLDDVRRALNVHGPVRRSNLESTGVRASAVLAPLYESDGEVYVILTRRAQTLRAHRGEVSFPGGGADPADADLWATALREAHEEIGLDPSSVERIGELDHLQTVTSRSYIVPFVGVLPGRPDLTANPAEVELVVHAPLSELLARRGLPRGALGASAAGPPHLLLRTGGRHRLGGHRGDAPQPAVGGHRPPSRPMTRGLAWSACRS